MRRIDVIGIGIGIFVAGGLLYWVFQLSGFDSSKAGIWSQAILVGGLVLWLLTYLWRAVTQTMTYNQQLKDYEEAVIEKRIAEMTPEQLQQLQAEVDQEKQQKPVHRESGSVDEQSKS
ncbi:MULTISPECIES: DUF3007 family protein [Oscillatoriales]|jgi:membrane protein implicated in regulation of membrane protease activity|uniref:DUF3007 family protein n=1 Tax=Limnospira platensis NIES-46 TaxID=1236695 RepID=A0A5M3TB84_LIMPL|nr:MULTISPECIES: DUF3007 family protein [Arthrospira]KDR56195.1 hypothetical protein APPUASWS_018200 [Arthrospira platensis str. Paraca]MDT9311367.1 DUF3007 family protein [Limnospira sp. Paracas R14]MBS0015005.1 DUF3007 family protein [Arthrospira sp. SH-MAG29]TVU54461.1 MAG: DUF3007 family protein [Arthrospira sp. PLM2.Bin9]GCE96197.1 hypothetical protein NIES46_42660 [Arthrospira platensis NIES-46]